MLLKNTASYVGFILIDSILKNNKIYSYNKICIYIFNFNFFLSYIVYFYNNFIKINCKCY